MIIRIVTLVTLLAGFLPSTILAAPAAKGQVANEVRVDISAQTMEVYRNGVLDDVWPVSTARNGKVTKRGSWSTDFLSENHKSSLYNNAPMPFSIFYDGNYAVHGTMNENKLGSPDSSGCVRLSRANAEVLFNRVRQDGQESFKITISE